MHNMKEYIEIFVFSGCDSTDSLLFSILIEKKGFSNFKLKQCRSNFLVFDKIPFDFLVKSFFSNFN